MHRRHRKRSHSQFSDCWRYLGRKQNEVRTSHSTHIFVVVLWCCISRTEFSTAHLAQFCTRFITKRTIVCWESLQAQYRYHISHFYLSGRAHRKRKVSRLSLLEGSWCLTLSTSSLPILSGLNQQLHHFWCPIYSPHWRSCFFIRAAPKQDCCASLQNFAVRAIIFYHKQ